MIPFWAGSGWVGMRERGARGLAAAGGWDLAGWFVGFCRWFPSDCSRFVSWLGLMGLVRGGDSRESLFVCGRAGSVVWWGRNTHVLLLCSESFWSSDTSLTCPIPPLAISIRNWIKLTPSQI
jgi:hypothetical protein